MTNDKLYGTVLNLVLSESRLAAFLFTIRIEELLLDSKGSLFPCYLLSNTHLMVHWRRAAHNSSAEQHVRAAIRG